MVEHIKFIRAVLPAITDSLCEIIFMAQGANNAVYLIITDNKKYIAKIGVNSSFRHLDREYSFLKSIQNIGPEPYLFQTDSQSGTQIIIESHIEGIHPFKLNNDYLHLLGKKINSYHSSTITGVDFPHDTWKSFMDNRIPRISSPSSHPLKKEIEMLTSTLRDTGDLIYNNESSDTMIPVHGDLIPLNILINSDTDEITIIDWEGIRFDEAEADLATCIKAYNLEGNNLSALLDGYKREINTKILWFRLLLHYLQVICWRIEYQIPSVTSAGRTDVESEIASELSTIKKLFARGSI